MAQVFRIHPHSRSGWLIGTVLLFVWLQLQALYGSSRVVIWAGRPWSDDELLPLLWLVGSGWGLVAFMLVLRRFRSNRLILHPQKDRIDRVYSNAWGASRKLGAPLKEWQINVHFFSEREQRRGRFKTLEIRCGTYRELLRPQQIDRPDELLDALGKLSPALGTYHQRSERQRAQQATRSD